MHSSSNSSKVTDENCFLCGNFEDRGGYILLNQHSYVVSDIAPLFPNHLLFCSRQHISSWADMNSSALIKQFQHLIILKEKLSNILNTKIVIFEHGGLHIGCNIICGINHAHFHLIPVPSNENIFDGELDAFLNDANREQIIHCHDMCSILNLNNYNFCHYLLTVDVDNSMRIFYSATQFESQIIRKFISYKYVLTDNYNWEYFLNSDLALTTTNLLKEILI